MTINLRNSWTSITFHYLVRNDSLNFVTSGMTINLRNSRTSITFHYLSPARVWHEAVVAGGVKGIWCRANTGKDRAQFPGRNLGDSAKPISLTWISSDSVGPPHLVSRPLRGDGDKYFSLPERKWKLAD